MFPENHRQFLQAEKVERISVWMDAKLLARPACLGPALLYRVVFWAADSRSASQDFPILQHNPNIHYRTHKIHQIVFWAKWNRSIFYTSFLKSFHHKCTLLLNNLNVKTYS